MVLLFILLNMLGDDNMERSLAAFLQPAKVENEMIVVSDRFKEDGKAVEWEIRAITSEENTNIMKKNTRRDKKTKQEIFDRNGYMNDLVAAAVVYPDLKNAELQKAYGVMGEANLLSKMLLVGEFMVLSEAVQKLSGLDVEDEDKVEEIKN